MTASTKCRFHQNETASLLRLPIVAPLGPPPPQPLAVMRRLLLLWCGVAVWVARGAAAAPGVEISGHGKVECGLASAAGIPACTLTLRDADGTVQLPQEAENAFRALAAAAVATCGPEEDPAPSGFRVVRGPCGLPTRQLVPHSQ